MQNTRAKEMPQTAAENQIVIKKYPNRRLYDTSSSAYVTLDELCTLVKQGKDFMVLDAKTNEDLTRQVLTQIIFEEESKGYRILPISFLRSIIGFYDNTKMQPAVTNYLEIMMNSFAQNQDKVRHLVDNSVGLSPLTHIGELGKQNMALINQTMQMFNPLGYFGGQQPDKAPEKKKAAGNK